MRAPGDEVMEPPILLVKPRDAAYWHARCAEAEAEIARLQAEVERLRALLGDA